MLTISRKHGEGIWIEHPEFEDIYVGLLEFFRGHQKIGIVAPPTYTINREEFIDRPVPREIHAWRQRFNAKRLKREEGYIKKERHLYGILNDLLSEIKFEIEISQSYLVKLNINNEEYLIEKGRLEEMTRWLGVIEDILKTTKQMEKEDVSFNS